MSLTPDAPEPSDSSPSAANAHGADVTPEAEGDGEPVRGRRQWATRGIWAMLDQGLFAGANFLITVGLAGWLTERDFGAFTTAYASFLVIGVFTTALLTEPMMVFGAKKYRDNLPDYFGRLIGGHLLVTLIGGLILGGIGLVVGITGEKLLGLAMCLLAFSQCSQLLPWMTRNACYIESNPRPAAVAGIIYLVLIVGSLLGLRVTEQLSIVTAIMTMFGASLAANLYLLFYLRPNLRAAVGIGDYGPVAHDHWRYGKWATLTGLTRYIPEQLPYIAVPVILGIAASTSPDLETGGALKALMNFSVPLILISWAASTLVTPMLVRAKHTPKFFKISGIMLTMTMGLPLLFWPVLGLLGETIIALLYSGKYVQHASLTWLIGLIPVIAGLDAVLHTQLKAAERPDRLFLASVASSAVLILLGLPMILAWGLTGAVLAILASYVAQAMTLCLMGGSIILRAAAPVPEDLGTDLRPLELPALPQEPLVSVIMANHDYGQMIGDAIQSVLDQTYGRFELIVVDDGSTDDSVQAIQPFLAKDTRVTLICQENLGQGGAWNTAFDRCRGDILCLLDSDDMFEPEKLATIVETFQSMPDVGMLQHPLQVIDVSNQPLQVIPFLSRLEEGWLAPTVLRRGGRWSFMPTSALAFHMEVARHFFPLNAKRYRGNADTLLFTVGPLLSRVHVIRRPLARYRIHGDNMMSSGASDRAGMRKQLRSVYNTLAGTNQHLKQLGMDLPQLDPRVHLQYRERLFQLSMLRGQRRGWIGRYIGLMQVLLTDDMYGRAQKLMSVPTYGLLPFIPRGWRAGWLDRAKGMGRAKGIAQTLLLLTRFKPRRAQELLDLSDSANLQAKPSVS
ncbi:MAG: glycosyltransferase [Planctomycetota bacterium]